MKMVFHKLIFHMIFAPGVSVPFVSMELLCFKVSVVLMGSSEVFFIVIRAPSEQNFHL